MNNDVVNVSFNLADLLGKTLKEAGTFCEAHGKVCRVIEIDNKPQLVTRDIVRGRVDLVITDGIVSSYRLD